MPRLNYTTSIEAGKTASEVVGILASHGARQIMMDYDEVGKIIGISFTVNTPHGVLPFRLPANDSAVLEVMKRQNKNGGIPGRFVNPDQARRVAWRIIKDWVEAQMALIETGMVVMEEIFMPYMMVGPQKTLFQLLEEKRFALPPGNR